ncbi:MAG TPA: NAD(P)/FAD-dependent oxidoreductase [Bacteroidales bacterium]|nr:NAD(P)/FAD-dependent oxidoreductase [Bacteroidales bacterium]
MEKKIIIIGAGIAGLSAGCFARMNGYNAEIYESGGLPGGLCTSWKKGGYTIDGCLHWLTGSSPSDSFYQIWKELGAIQGRRIYDHKEFYRFTGQDGRTLILYSDADRLEKHLIELSPDDIKPIKLLCNLIRKFSKFNTSQNKAYELFNFIDVINMMISMMPYMKLFRFCSEQSMADFAERFKDPLIYEVFPQILADKDMSLLALVATMALLNKKGGGFPEGGSLEFAKAIEKRFLNLGGKIFYGKKVEKIIVKENKACGVFLAKGEEHQADYIISAADLHTTTYNMLDGKYIEPQHEELFNKAKIFKSSVQVSIGVNMDFPDEPDCIAQIYKLDFPLLVGNQRIDWFVVRHYNFDHSLAPIGKSVVECTYMVDDFEFWERLYNTNRAGYKAEKERILSITIEELNRKYPDLSSCIEVTDVLTPMTYVRYTGNYKGSYMTWVMTPDLIKNHRVIKKTLPGLENFWLSGMWVVPPGGVPSGAKSSRDIIQIICLKDRKKFITTVP